MAPDASYTSRRSFINALAKVSGAAMCATLPLPGLTQSVLFWQRSWTVGEIMDLFISEVPGGPLPQTVDTLKAGSRDAVVTGIVTTMFASLEVIQKAIVLNANFIIAHEPVFYNHQDSTDWLQKDEVYQYKAGLLQKHNIAVWRNHDYIHRYRPDGVMQGLIEGLGWSAYPSSGAIGKNITVPVTTLQSLMQELKSKLDITTMRYIGQPLQKVSKVLLLPGAIGGRIQITSASASKPDVLVCGEISEWETAEYIRDAQAKGQQIALIVLGHNDSEDEGSAFMAKWLLKKVPDVKTTHVNAKSPLLFY